MPGDATLLRSTRSWPWGNCCLVAVVWTAEALLLVFHGMHDNMHLPDHHRVQPPEQSAEVVGRVKLYIIVNQLPAPLDDGLAPRPFELGGEFVLHHEHHLLPEVVVVGVPVPGEGRVLPGG
jgi:hypothetical protein